MGKYNFLENYKPALANFKDKSLLELLFDYSAVTSIEPLTIRNINLNTLLY